MLSSRQKCPDNSRFWICISSIILAFNWITEIYFEVLIWQYEHIFYGVLQIVFAQKSSVFQETKILEFKTVLFDRDLRYKIGLRNDNENTTLTWTQSRSQRPRSFWSATGIGTSGTNRVLFVVPTAQARTTKSNKKQETKIFMRRFSFLSEN